MKYLWIIAAILLIVMCASTWFAFQRPDFVAALAAAAAGAIWKAFLAHAKGLETPEQLQKRAREGRERNDR
jgi:hypothetical protein